MARIELPIHQVEIVRAGSASYGRAKFALDESGSTSIIDIDASATNEARLSIEEDELREVERTERESADSVRTVRVEFINPAIDIEDVEYDTQHRRATVADLFLKRAGFPRKIMRIRFMWGTVVEYPITQDAPIVGMITYVLGPPVVGD